MNNNSMNPANNRQNNHPNNNRSINNRPVNPPPANCAPTPPADCAPTPPPVKEIRVAADAPYPEIQVLGPDPKMGALILDNVGGSNSEISTVALYVYNHFISNEEFKKVANIFKRIAIVEMRHLDIFSELSLALGVEPRFWTIQNERFRYWTPSYVNYALDLKTMIHRALNGELAAIEKYQQQIAVTNDPNIVANLQRVILDEELHADIFRQMIRTYKL